MPNHGILFQFNLKPLLLARLLNAPFGDPALFVEVLWERRALLFDLGDFPGIRPAKLLKVSHAFVSHTHIDHFIGFDALLRLMLNREKVLKIYGPPGFLTNIRGKLSGYTWNLTAEYPFSIQAAEAHPDRILTRTFHCHERFAPGEVEEKVFRGVLEEDPQMQIMATHLDHLIPCLAFAVKERFHINVHKDYLDRMGLPVGTWLKELKMAIWRGEGDDFCLQVPQKDRDAMFTTELPLSALKDAITITPGQKIVYVSDCRFSEGNVGKIIKLAEGADLFFCEAAFLEKDRKRAEERAHLTARQAGELARKARVKKLNIFHFSPKYEKSADLLYREAEEAFQG
ncbi:MAG: ribonuclease Z [Deltaproteobacteria bacterium]|nr:ribonuclease Z [Deltaproteobacteria bacterium]